MEKILWRIVAGLAERATVVVVAFLVDRELFDGQVGAQLVAAVRAALAQFGSNL